MKDSRIEEAGSTSDLAALRAVQTHVRERQAIAKQDLEAARGEPEIGEYVKRVKELAQYESVVCEVSYVHRV